MWIMPCIGNHRITITGNNKRQCRWPRYDNYVLMRVVGRPLSLCCSFISLAFRSMSCKGKCRASAGIYKRSTNIHRESTNIYRTSESKQTSKASRQAKKHAITKERKKKKREDEIMKAIYPSSSNIYRTHPSTFCQASIDKLGAIYRYRTSIEHIYRHCVSGVGGKCRLNCGQRCGDKMQN